MSLQSTFPAHLKRAPAEAATATMASLPAALPTAARLLLRMLSKLQHGHLHLFTPDQGEYFFGERPQSGTEHAVSCLHIHDWRACRKILQGGDIGFAESLHAGWVSSPDLSALMRLALQNEAVLENALFGGKWMNLWYRLKHVLRPNTRRGSRRNIHAHYDLGNDFYQLWLDSSWTYSSALFEGDYSRSLQAAQSAKYQRILDALALPRGAKILEIGCGWGGFAMHAAQRGMRVDGITISPAQLAIAQQRVAQGGYADQVQLRLCDYRDLQEEYDAIVSIEMFEAVGEKYWPGYFSVLQRCLKPGARAVVQSITIDEKHFLRYRSGTDFIQQYIFPGGMLPSPPRFCQQAEKQGLTVQQAFAFGKDYAETLRRWRQQFLLERKPIAALGFDQAFMRIWELYFAYCEAGFEEGRTDVMQFLLEKRA